MAFRASSVTGTLTAAAQVVGPFYPSAQARFAVSVEGSFSGGAVNLQVSHTGASGTFYTVDNGSFTATTEQFAYQACGSDVWQLVAGSGFTGSATVFMGQ